jgi:hypothetical protein
LAEQRVHSEQTYTKYRGHQTQATKTSGIFRKLATTFTFSVGCHDVLSRHMTGQMSRFLLPTDLELLNHLTFAGGLSFL